MAEEMSLQRAAVGSKVWFAEEKRPYVVQARSDRYLVCTKPFNPRRTVLYTIVDLQEQIRGTENVVFGLGQETRDQCEATLRRMSAGKSAVSHRNRVPLHIHRVAEYPHV